MAKVNNVNCCVFGCHSKAGREKHLSFHKFPKAGENRVSVKTRFDTFELVDRRKAWEKAIKSNKTISNYMRVCSLHFTEENYHKQPLDGTNKRKALLKTAVPSQNLPIASFSTAREPQARRTFMRKQLQEESLSTQPQFEEQETRMSIDNEYNDNESQLPASADNQDPIANILKCDVCIQMDERSFTEPFISLLDTDEKINTVTGVKTIQLLNTIVSNVEKLNCARRLRRFSVKERVILTLMKLKCNTSFVLLAVLFRTTSGTCKTIFKETIGLLASVMSTVIEFPSKEEILNNMPFCFKEFQNVRIVVDCTEIPISAVKCLHCRIKTYSHYKSRQTVKFMTGVSPGGLITFISKAYGGRASDKAIFEQSKLIELLEPGVDAIMVDKGFLIDNIANDHFIKVIRPPFLRKKQQFSTAEANHTRKIAAARVHVERVNQRIKLFSILNSPIHSNLLPYMDQIFIVICGLVNLSPPILHENKFM